MADPINVVPPTQNNGDGATVDIQPSVPVNNNVVEELKELRKKYADLQTKQLPTEDVDKKISDALKAKEQEEQTKNWQKAQDLFLAKHKEFHPDNDQGGIKRSALDRELKILNRDGLSTIEDLVSILERAKVLATANVRSEIVPVRIDPSIPNTPSEPRSSNASNLQPKELRLIQQMGWTEERYLRLKLRDPSFVENALRQAL